MIVTPEELAAYADGELEGAEAARVVLAVAASPELMRQAQRHRALRERIGAEFAPILDQEVPERLAALLRPPVPPAERVPAREPEALALEPGAPLAMPSAGRPGLPHRGWLLLPLLAAALGVAAFYPGGDEREPSAPKEQRVVMSGVG